MKHLRFRSWVTMALLLLSSCRPPTATPTVSREETSVAGLPIDGLPFILRPTDSASEIAETQIEFLIDHSSSVEDVCGNYGARRYEFVNFLISILQRIPEPLSQRLIIGAGIFGNGIAENNYKSLIPPTLLTSPSFRLLATPPKSPDNSQNYNDGIQHALEKLNIDGQTNKILVIITDGKFFSEYPVDVKEKLREITYDGKLKVLIGLICPESPSLTQDIAFWFEEISNNNVLVFSLEEMAGQFLNQLRAWAFLPENSISMSKETYQGEIPIGGYYSSLGFWYWNSDPTNRPFIADLTATDERKKFPVVENATPTYLPIQILPGCPIHNFVIGPGTTDHWFLFMIPQEFFHLRANLKSVNGDMPEIINNNATHFQIEISDDSLKEELANRKDCFSAQLFWKYTNKTNLSSEGTVEFETCPESETLCFVESHWIPFFSSKGDIEIKIRLASKSDTAKRVWESESTYFQVKFMAEFDPTVYLTPFTEIRPSIVQKEISFKNIASLDRLEVFLVSKTDLDDQNCPFPQNHQPAGGKYNVRYLEKKQSCSSTDLMSGENICLSYTNNGELGYILSVIAYEHVFTVCHYDHLYFYWHPDDVSKESILECIISYPDITSCKNTSKPVFLP